MHYIVGTSFRVTPNPKALIRDKRFEPQQFYSLIHISRKDNKMVYTFLGGGKKITVDFNNCREADIFISKFKNENLPNYDKQLPVVDNIAD